MAKPAISTEHYNLTLYTHLCTKYMADITILHINRLHESHSGLLHKTYGCYFQRTPVRKDLDPSAQLHVDIVPLGGSSIINDIPLCYGLGFCAPL